MLNYIKRLLNPPVARWTTNTEKEFPHLEADKYFLVKSEAEGTLMFTPSQVKAAKKTADKNLEDQ